MTPSPPQAKLAKLVTLKKGVQRREPTAEVMDLERMEQKLWAEYRETDQWVQVLQRTADKEVIEDARKKARRAHSRHQKCVDRILQIHKDRLFVEQSVVERGELREVLATPQKQ